MRLAPVVIALAMASSVSAQDADGHSEHYDDALNCYVVSKFVASVYRNGAQEWPDNSEPGLSIAESYLPVLAYHGWKMGKSPEEIMNEVNQTYANYSEKSLSTLNVFARPVRSQDTKEAFQDAQDELLNKMIDQSNACGGIPVFSLPAE